MAIRNRRITTMVQKKIVFWLILIVLTTVLIDFLVI